MPRKCCMPGCRGNYDNGPKVSVFSFPSEESLKQKWISAVHRKDWAPSKQSVVCELHFHPNDIMSSISMYDPRTGKLLSAPLGHRRLKKGTLITLNCHIAVKREEDPLLENEIITEPQDVKNEIKTEAEECEDIDIKYETLPVANQFASIKTISEVDEKEESLDKFLLDFGKPSQSTQVDGTNIGTCECNAVQSHGVCASDHTENESVNNSTQTADRSLKCCVCHKCEVCFKSHVPTHIPENTGDKSMNRKFCQMKYFDKSNNSILPHTHINENTFMANECFKPFSKYCDPKDDLYTHNNEKHSKCNICNKSFTRKSSLTGHLRIHNNEKPFECYICNKSFTQKSSLTGHLRIHTNEKPFECRICKMSFTRKSDLATHLRIHSNEKPFGCNICNKSFTNKSVLTRHLPIHSNEKPFECNICNKLFTRKCHLTGHLRIHNNEKPFECNICNKLFSRKYHLIRHLHIHSN